MVVIARWVGNPGIISAVSDFRDPLLGQISQVDFRFHLKKADQSANSPSYPSQLSFRGPCYATPEGVTIGYDKHAREEATGVAPLRASSKRRSLS